LRRDLPAPDAARGRDVAAAPALGARAAAGGTSPLRVRLLRPAWLGLAGRPRGGVPRPFALRIAIAPVPGQRTPFLRVPAPRALTRSALARPPPTGSSCPRPGAALIRGPARCFEIEPSRASGVTHRRPRTGRRSSTAAANAGSGTAPRPRG